MSWLFGIRKDPIVLPEIPGGGNVAGGESSGENPPSGGAGSGDSDDRGSGSGSYRFDSTALERAAKSARELELSPHAKQILELTMMQERNKELEQLTKVKEFEAHIENSKSEQIRVQHEERRKTIAEETKHNQQRAQYQDQLARKRYEEQLAQQQRANEENLRKQEESLAKQEAMRRAALEKELEMRERIDMKKIEAEVKARGKVERENHDLYLEKIRLKASERRTSNLEMMKTATAAMGIGFKTFISEWDRVAIAVGAMALTFYAAKRSTKVVADHVMARLMRPTLIKEFYGFTLLDFFRHPLRTVRRLTTRSENTLKDVVLEPTLEERLSMYTEAVSNTKKNKGVYMNMLLYGPPGTGKTLFAKRLAQHCGMNCAIMSGADIAPMGRNGVLAIHRLFDYASKYRRGLLVFIDEADAFLKRRTTEIISEDLRSALNAFLARTGDMSDKFMLVLASNTPDQLDEALHNRIHATIEFKVPGYEERERLVRLYFDRFILVPATEGKRRLKVETFDYSEMCSEIARLTEGFSGREIANMAAIWQASAFTSKKGILTREMIMKLVHQSIEEHNRKMAWHEVKPKLQSVQKDGCIESNYGGVQKSMWSPPLLGDHIVEQQSSKDKSDTAAETKKPSN